VSLRVEPLQPDHVPAVAAIERASSPAPWSEGLFRGEFDVPAPTRTWLVALDGTDTVVGFAGVMYVDDEAHVMNIAVAPTVRRLGVGRRLLGGLVEAALGVGARHLTLEVRTSNDAALALYRRFGLAPAGVRRRYYPDGEDALVLWAHDIDRPDYRRRLDGLLEVEP
jgi:[ribosomal protein S18]-alanine N-acetyltransferase